MFMKYKMLQAMTGYEKLNQSVYSIALHVVSTKLFSHENSYKLDYDYSDPEQFHRFDETFSDVIEQTSIDNNFAMLLGRCFALADHIIANDLTVDQLTALSDKDILSITADYRAIYINALGRAIRKVIDDKQNTKVSEYIDKVGEWEKELDQAESERDHGNVEYCDEQLNHWNKLVSYLTNPLPMIDLLIDFENQHFYSFSDKDAAKTAIEFTDDVSKLKLASFDELSFAKSLSDYLVFDETQQITA